MRFRRITALLSGAAVLMTTVMGGCFSVPAAETEADRRMIAAAESISSTEILPVPLTEGPSEMWQAGQTEYNAEKEAGRNETAVTETNPPVTEKTGPPEQTAAETEQKAETETRPEDHTEKESGTESIPATEQQSGSEKETEPSTGQPETEISSEKVTETEANFETELQTETGLQTEAELQEETEPEILPEAETESELETEIYLDEMEEETETEEEYSDDSYYYNGSYWDPSWYFKRDFRFSQVKKQYAIAHGDRSNRIYEQPDQKSAIVGEVPFFGLVCVLKSVGDWSYVESGDVRGFIPFSELESGSDATKMVDLIGEKGFETATPDIEIADNMAFTYTEYPKENARAVGQVQSGSLVYILAKPQDEKDWYFVESGDVRGFIQKSDLFSGGSVASILQDSGNENLATELISPEDNRSLYFSLSSVKPAASSMGEEIAEYATTFVGKIPYIWGGTSLSYGADCSGFVQSIFNSFGINLPRIAQDQGANGEIVPDVEDAQPGDVVYWGSNPHVGIYLGDGKVVHCSGHSYNTAENPGTGPMISNVDFMPITSIRRYIILQDNNEGIAETGFRTDGTEYSQKQMELIWAIVAQEDNGSYQGALAVISSAMNRTESGKWGYEGGNALSQLTAPGQYCYSMDSYWKPRLNGNVPDYVKQAVDDCLRRGIRNHNFTSFRSRKGKTTGAGAVQIGGNWFFDT